MSGFPYLPAMKAAPKILFGMAVVILLASFLGDALGLTAPSVMDDPLLARDKTAKLFSAAATALYSAAFPLFGSALLHRLDKFAEGRS